MNGLCGKYNFNRDTLFIAIHILDQLIESNFEGLNEDFELIGGVLVLLTTKYNEVYPVTIDQICMVMEKYYNRSKFFDIESKILTNINFEMPENTIYSRLYNQLEPSNGKKNNSDSDKENDVNSENTDTDSSEKDYSKNGQNMALKTLKAIKDIECFKYGDEILFQALSIHLRKQQPKGVSLNSVKINYIRSVLKNLFDGEKQISMKKAEPVQASKKPRFFFF